MREKLLPWLPAGSFCPCVWRALAVPSLPNAWEGVAGGEGEGGEGRMEVRGESLGGVELPKGNNTRSRRHKTKGLLAGKRATKVPHRGV